MRSLAPNPAASRQRPATPSDPLEQRLQALARQVADPDGGLFGPASPVWQIQRHAVLFAGAGRATLLQLAHPWVAQAIADHSTVAHDALGRFRRTFGWVFPMVFGDLDQALRAARAVHAIHSGVRGELAREAGPFAARSRYDATGVDASRWVLATLWDTSVRMYEAFVHPLDPAEKWAYYDEIRRFAGLFGIPEEELPADWDTFLDYNRAMWTSGELTVTPEARRLARALFHPARPTLAAALLPRYLRWTADWLPEPIRHGFELRAGTAGRWGRALTTALRQEHLLPPGLRYVPAYHAARARLAGRPRPGPLPRALGRIVLGSRASSTPRPARDP